MASQPGSQKAETKRPISAQLLVHVSRRSESCSRYPVHKLDKLQTALGKRWSATYAQNTPFESRSPAIKTSWDLERTAKRKSGSFFLRRTTPQSTSNLRTGTPQKLPAVVNTNILRHLHNLHFDAGDEGCAACYLRDLYSLSLVNKDWGSAAKKILYQTIWLLSSHDRACPSKAWVLAQVRAKLVRRTLREHEGLALQVLNINVSGLQRIYKNSRAERTEILDLLASLVMACPNLERLRGFYFNYNHQFDQLSHALSTRRRLKEMVWHVSKRPTDVGQQEPFAYHYNNPTESFIRHSEQWGHLETLFLHAETTDCLDYRAFVITFRQLPLLRHLFISNFSAEDFIDRTLRAIPPSLVSLRLQELPGLTDAAFNRLAQSGALNSIQNLSIIKQEIQSLDLVASLIALPNLIRFTLHQTRPVCHLTHPLPKLASKTLQYLHWSTLVPSAATPLLAHAIASKSFPSLTRLRTTSDYEGLLQAQCKPLARVTQEDDLILSNSPISPRRRRPSRESTRLSLTSPSLSSLSMNDSAHGSNYIDDEDEDDECQPFYSTLPPARRAAQRRIDDARLVPGLKFVVELEGDVKDVVTVRHYMGRLESDVKYWLEPDVKGSDTSVIDLRDLWVPGIMRGWCGGGQWSERGNTPPLPSFISSHGTTTTYINRAATNRASSYVGYGYTPGRGFQQGVGPATEKQRTFEHELRQMDHVMDLQVFF